MSKNFILTTKKVAMTAMTAMLIASQLCGCSSALGKDIESMIADGEQIEIVVDTPEDIKQGEDALPNWEQLAKLTDQEDLRDLIDEQLKIISFGGSKNGVMYVDPETKDWEPNNTLENVFKNKKFLESFDNSDVQNSIQEEVRKTYCDVDGESSDNLRLAALNAYFNIFADDEEAGYFNGDSTLTRAEFMTGLARASEKADKKAKASDKLISALGDSEATVYAEYVVGNSYLDTESKSLDEKTFNGTITRAEAVYMLANKYYSEELKNETTDGSTYSDCKNAGDVIKTAGEASYVKKVALKVMLDNPTDGIEENLYKALKLAYEHKLLTEDGEVVDESRWNEALTKVEALQMIVNVYRDLGTTISCDRGNSDGEEVAEEKTKEKKILTYEEFAAAVGYDDMPLFSEEDKKEYYDGYVVCANSPDTDTEALIEESKSMIPEIYDEVKARTEENEKIREQEQKEQQGTVDTNGITGGNQPTVDQTPVDNTQQTPVISDEEAKRLRDEYNRKSAGHTGDTSGCPANVLTDEERKERQEEFNIQAY